MHSRRGLCLLILLIKATWAYKTSYLVQGSKCQIPEVQAKDSPVTRYFTPLGPTQCVKLLPLSAVVYNRGRTIASLVLFPHRYQSYRHEGVMECQYRTLDLPKKNDLEFSDKVKIIENKTELDPSIKNLYIFCRDSLSRLMMYKNAHLITLKTPEIESKIESSNLERTSTDPKLGIIMLQIDSMSTASFNRSMPNVNKYLNRMGWFQLKGNHKVGMNTRPNLNYIFTGSTEYEQEIFKDFDLNDYVTEYAEDMKDETLAFCANRTDFESRTIRTMLEDLPSTTYRNYYTCNWIYPVFERLYDQMIEFAITFRKERYMGLYVSSAHSHDDVSGASQLKLPMEGYMKRLDSLGIRNDAIVFLYGDHGLRFGPQRASYEGAREDAMPMLWISLPKWIQEKYPEIPKALRVNKNRLTSHLDVYHTLRHIIELNGGTTSEPNREKCKSCQSLFKEIPENRDCADAGIPSYYCYCNAYKTLSPKVLRREKAEALGDLVYYMNHQIQKYARNRCGKVADASIIKAWKSGDTMVVIFKANLPKRAYEGIVTKGSDIYSEIRIQNLYAARKVKYCGPRQVVDFCICQSCGVSNHFKSLILGYVLGLIYFIT